MIYHSPHTWDEQEVQLRNQPKEARMSVLVTMRVKVHDFEGTKQAVEKYGDVMLKAGAHWFKVYQRDGDDKEVLWLMEFDSHEAFEKSGSAFGEDFVSLINPASDWDDAVWKLSLQKE
jgi:Tat protein secretion system quality control protein TatD with DNase activity